MNLLIWLDNNISSLKKQKIEFVNGMPLVPKNMVDDGIPIKIETYQFRHEISALEKKQCLLCFYTSDNLIKNRLKTINKDIKEFKEYAAIVGMDISPSVNMLKPRQLQNILINRVYDCLLATNGIKIAYNCRVGDFSTKSTINDFEKNKTIVFGTLGCKRKFLFYSYEIYKYVILKLQPKYICFYGSITECDINYIFKTNNYSNIYIYPGHNYRSRIKKSVFITGTDKHTVNNSNARIASNILTHNESKINTAKLFSSVEDNYGC